MTCDDDGRGTVVSFLSLGRYLPKLYLEDDKKLKMLRRHLKTRYDMTPEDYCQRQGLKDNSPAYTEQRSALAKKIGLGRKPKPKKPAKAPPQADREEAHY